MLVDHSFDCFLCYDVLFVFGLNKYVTDVCILNLTLGNLYFSATFILQSADRLAVLADYQTDGIVRYRYDVGA